MTADPLPVLPYAGTSGHSGSDTSRERAERADSDGTTTKRQSEALASLGARHGDGMTWKELGLARGWHHGTASGVLSVLHKEGHVARLTERRDRCLVYVLPQYTQGRETTEQGRQDPIDAALQEWLARDAEGWSKAGRDPKEFVRAMRTLTGYGA